MAVRDGVFVIAEAGVNHNGRLDLAHKLVEAAAQAGADAVKFQTFRAENLATSAAPKAEYQERTTGASSQLEMLKGLELDADAYRALARQAGELGIEFMSTPFDPESVLLLESIGVQRFKSPSGEITNPVLLRAMAATGKPMIVSTGMSTIAEVEGALAVLGAEFARRSGDSVDPANAASHPLVRDKVTLLHCTTEYPAPPEAVNLRAMQTMATAFGVPVGYSDHTLGIEISCAAVAMGASVIEKHFTLDRSLPGPDHAASLEAKDLGAFVVSLRTVAGSLGSGRKEPHASEIRNRVVARRSIVAATAIRRGERFTTDNLTVKRPGNGIPASRYDEWIGRVAARDYAADELIDV